MYVRVPCMRHKVVFMSIVLSDLYNISCSKGDGIQSTGNKNRAETCMTAESYFGSYVSLAEQSEAWGNLRRWVKSSISMLIHLKNEVA